MTQTTPIGFETELADMIGDYTTRLRRGESPRLDEYAEQHPHLASTFRKLAEMVSALPASRADVPELVGFRIVRELGRGGMGVVYEAVDDTLHRHVALKALPAAAAAQPQRLERFRREARAAARLHHTNIVPVFGIGEQNGVHYYAMQAIEGIGLDRLTAKPDVRQVGLWGAKIAEALAHAHALGVLHRDVKPSNVLIDAGGEPYLTDFGLAKLNDAEDLTGPGDFIGTLRYAAPEQLHDRADERSDLYGLGVTLYELLAGQPAFPATDRTALLRQIAEDEPAPLPSHVPRDLAVIVRKAMAKAPSDRYASAADFAADLRRFEGGDPIAAAPLTIRERTRRWARRHPAIAGLSAAVAALLIAFAATVSIAYWRTSKALERAEYGENNARASLDQTLEAIRKTHAIVDSMPDGYLTFVVGPACAGAESLSAIGISTNTTVEVIDRLTELYEAFLQKPLVEPAARLEQARSWRRLAFLYAERNRLDDAENAYRAAIAATEDLARLEPESVVAHRESALARGYYGAYLKSFKQPEGDFVTRAVQDLKALADADPHDDDSPSECGELLYRYAIFHTQSNTRKPLLHDALAHLRTAQSRARTSATRKRMDFAYESLMHVYRAERSFPDLQKTFLAWSASDPESATLRLRLAILGADILDLTKLFEDRKELGTAWKSIVQEQLEAYIRLGGLATNEVRILSVKGHFRDDPAFQKLFASIPTSPTAFIGPKGLAGRPENEK